MNKAHILIDMLWKRYKEECPYAAKAEEIFGETKHDHIAFRSVNDCSPIGLVHGIDDLKFLWESMGWVIGGHYNIESKNIRAIHLNPPEESLPKVFISEFCTEKLPDNQKIYEFLSKNRVPFNRKHLQDASPEMLFWYLNHPMWVNNVKYEDLLELEKISQYVAWSRLFGNKVNHFTIDVSSVRDGSYEIEFIYNEMKEAGIPMKEDIEGIGSELAQTSTKAAELPVLVLKDDEYVYMKWPYAYYEVAERGLVRFEGFKADQTKSLFSMTKKNEN